MMILRNAWMTAAAALLALSSLPAEAQRYGRFNRSSSSAPESNAEPGFEKDVFTFVRIRYRSDYGWQRGRGDWRTDGPDAEWNLALRLQQMTSLKVNGQGLVLELTDPELFNYPFIYMVEVGDLIFQDAEVPLLRKYLLNGGFLMVDDFWGEESWEHFSQEMEKVFPDRPAEEIPITHPVFNIVFPLKEKPQIPNVELGQMSQYNGGITWEREDARTPHYKAIYDDNGRIMVMICHNTDLGDGWEREGTYYYYFKEFSEKKAFPLGINIIVYAMTH